MGTNLTKSRFFIAAPVFFLLEHSGRFLIINYATREDHGPVGGRGSRLAAPAELGDTPLTHGMLIALAIPAGSPGSLPLSLGRACGA